MASGENNSYAEINRKIETLLKELFPDAYTPREGYIPYVTALPHKYARYYTFFNPSYHPLTKKDKQKLSSIRAESKKLARAIKELSPGEWVRLNKNRNYHLSLGLLLGMLYDLAKVAGENEESLAIPRGRQKTHYRGLIEEMGQDFKLITGREPKLSKNILGEPSGKFYKFVSGIFDILGLREKVNIESTIRRLDMK